MWIETEKCELKHETRIILQYIQQLQKIGKVNMKIGIIDADLIGRKRHRFPNLACMKISNYHKQQGHEVELLMDYESIIEYDKVYISKVFTDTPFPTEVLSLPNVEYGGTGFYFDKAPNLDDEIEHTFPDYHLYDDFVKEMMSKGKRRNEFKEYLDYSIGFLTRGCFRKCGFCVNQKYDRVFKHSPLKEFYDPTRKKICLLDDNFLGCPQWKEMLEELRATGKPFKFKQGLDERILTDEKCELLFSSKYDTHITFAFDKIEDYEIIEEKLKMIRRHTDKQIIFYVLVGFDKTGKYDENFWKQDIEDMFKRLELLGKYKVSPYIMRYEKWKESKYRGTYVTVARWCNQFSWFKNVSLHDFVFEVDKKNGVQGYYSSWRYYDELKADLPHIVEKYCYRNFYQEA